MSDTNGKKILNKQVSDSIELRALDLYDMSTVLTVSLQ